MKAKLISDTRPMTFEGELNMFLASHEILKVTYSTSVVDGQCLFTALVLYKGISYYRDDEFAG